MNNQQSAATPQLPSYVTSATPNPPDKRAPCRDTAPTYAGIFLWFVFWHDAVNSNNLGGGLASGLGMAMLGLFLSALICHFLFYLVPGLLGQKTGLPLYIVGTSTFGTTGGFLMPGFLMGVLQFGWLGVNICFSAGAVAEFLHMKDQAWIIMIIWGALAAFVGLKGIQDVAKVATYLPLIPLGVLLIMFVKTLSGLSGFDDKALTSLTQNIHPLVVRANDLGASGATAPSGIGVLSGHLTLGVLAFIITYVVGFFATAGAAGVDFGTNSRDKKDVSMGGLVGVALAILLTAGLSTCIVAGVYGSKALTGDESAAVVQSVKKAMDTAAADAKKAGKTLTAEERDKAMGAIVAAQPNLAAKATASAASAVLAKIDDEERKAGTALPDDKKESLALEEAHGALYRSTSLFKIIVGEKTAGLFMFLLALAAFPPACFSSFIAANSFKTTLPKVNPFISVGLGATVSVLLAISGKAGDAVGVFKIVGASFGPICGAMMVDYLLNGCTWSGPRAGFNPAGWIAWLLGFMVGAADQLGKLFGIKIAGVEIPEIPAAPVAAFIVGAIVYFLCYKIGLKSAVVPLPKK